ncbi:MAG: radical SAM family heme chaperone HemW [Luteitalea sp.]|nr:radical SAM family heme chaperone HemW [Luteitalea sp.]
MRAGSPRRPRLSRAASAQCGRRRKLAHGVGGAEVCPEKVALTYERASPRAPACRTAADAGRASGRQVARWSGWIVEVRGARGEGQGLSQDLGTSAEGSGLIGASSTSTREAATSSSAPCPRPSDSPRPSPLAPRPCRLGAYIHVPFCSAICHYCNFNRGLLDAALKTCYVRALADEIRRMSDQEVVVDTIYLGGGTPSLLDPHELDAILEACRGAFRLAPDAEITLEANPESVSAERLTAFRAAGVTRLSYGVQSFRDEELRRLGRLHDAAGARTAYDRARAAGFDNINLDLMMWLPQQTVAQWLESVDALIELGPEHASLYLLELYPNAPLKEDMARQQWSLAPDEDAAAMYMQSLAHLDAAGYEQYEISNVAREGHASRHNLKYWSDGEWLAFGCGAHGTRARARWCNVQSITEYIGRVEAGQPPVAERRILDAEAAGAEAIITALRLTRGVNTDQVRERYGIDVHQRYAAALQPFLEMGYLRVEWPSIRLTRAGMLIANEVMQVFV